MPDPGFIVVEARFPHMLPLPESSVVNVSVLDAAGASVVGETVEDIVPGVPSATAAIDATDLPPATYQVATTIRDRAGTLIGAGSRETVTWPGRSEEFRNIRILNNVVWELLKAERETIDRTRTYTFKSPKRRWVYVAATAQATGGTVSLSLDQRKDIISFKKGEKATKEAMSPLPKGEHKLTVRAPGGGEIESLVVRSIPEILLHEFSGLHRFEGESGMPVLDFYDAYVMNNVNTFIGAPGYLTEEHAFFPTFSRWKRNGGRLFAGCSARGTPDTGEEPFTVEQAYAFMSTSRSLNAALVEGIIIDEFVGYDDPSYSSYGAAIRKLKETPKFQDKLFYVYAGTIHGNEHGRALAKAVMDTDGVIAWERYLHTPPNETAALNGLKEQLVDLVYGYSDGCPGSIEHLAVCFGFFSAPGGHTCNTTPNMNHKVWLDMQFNVVANNPAFWGTYGLMGYHTSYSNEEILRWMCKLFRHYGIEGNTEPATNDLYVSPHLVNGDFVNGTKGWKIAPAEENGIRAAGKAGLGGFQGRYGSPEGDTGVVTTRSAKGPNRITQEIKHLEPGRLYAFRMISTDYNDMSKRDIQAVSVTLDDVDLVPGRSFAAIFPSLGFVYIDIHKNWMNYHWYLFRAKGTSARVTITDWAGDDEPGGPVGQQLMFNYVQVHPYYAPEEE